MDKTMAEMFGNMIDSMDDGDYSHMHKKCPRCGSDDTMFDRNSGTYECWGKCMKSFV